MIGRKLLHYEIVETLGKGGMGEVYRAHDTKLGRDVAIKVLPEDLSKDPERRGRFEHEARVIAALNHPNIVTIHAVDEVDGRHLIVMELVKGKTLREFIPTDGVSLGWFFSVAIPLVDAMCSAHAQGITHRDLKPTNIMVTDEGRLKVLDFGLAKLVQEATAMEETATVGQFTGEGQILGTVSYMSPEQVEGKPLDGRSDIFSLGIVFYEMLTGSRPFVGDSNASTISAILRDKPSLVSDVRAALPRHLGRIVRRCLAKEPERRYQSPVDLRNDLQELAAEVDSGDVEAHVVDSGADRSDAWSSDPQASRSSESIVLPGTRRMYWWGLGVIGVLVVAVVWWMAQKPESRETTGGRGAMVSTEGATLGVIGFENLSDPDDEENLGRMLMGLVTTGLAEPGGLQVASTAKVLAARREAQAGDRAFDASRAPEAARKAGATVMLVGQVIRDGERTILTAELVDVASGNALGSIRKQAATNSELFELAGGIAHDVRELMGVTSSDAAAKDIDLAKSITDSPEAYRSFAAGEVAVHQGNYNEAVELFNQAIQIDSTFALAYLRLLLAYTWNTETDKGLAAVQRGMKYIDRLPERWRIVYQANVEYYEGNPDGAYDKMIRLIETSPDIPDAYNLLGEILTHFSRYEDPRRAREYFERALEIDPTFEVVLFHLVEDYIKMNDPTSIEALINYYRERNPADRRVLTMEVTYLIAQQEYVKAITRVENRMHDGDLTMWEDLATSLALNGEWQRSLELSQQVVDRQDRGHSLAWAFKSRANALIGLGRVAEGIVDLDRASAVFGGGGPVRWADSIVQSFRVVQSYVLCEAGDLLGGIAKAKRGTQDDPRSTETYYALVHAFLQAGRTKEAEDTLGELRKIQAGNLCPLDAFFEHLSLAELETSRKNEEAAMGALRRIEAMPIEQRDPWVQWRIEGDVKAAFGDLDGAAAAYRKVLESRQVLMYHQGRSLAVDRIPVLFRLAQVEEQAGRVADAKRYYESYLDRWGNADIDIPNVVESRRRLEVLKNL